jgi:hypothetical protein
VICGACEFQRATFNIEVDRSNGVGDCICPTYMWADEQILARIGGTTWIVSRRYLRRVPNR